VFQQFTGIVMPGIHDILVLVGTHVIVSDTRDEALLVNRSNGNRVHCLEILADDIDLIGWGIVDLSPASNDFCL
jgi:hypothetical protein